jgi:hypothetical protein
MKQYFLSVGLRSIRMAIDSNNQKKDSDMKKSVIFIPGLSDLI